MANKNIRGITIEIGGDTTKLGKALEDSEKKGRSLNAELKEIQKGLKFDPTNVELLAQKQTVLTQNIEETSKKLDTLREAERQVIEQFKRGEVAEEQVRALKREITQTEGVLGSMKSELDSTNRAMKDLADGTDSAEKHTKEYADRLKEAEQDLKDFGDSARDTFDTLAKGAGALGAGAVAGAGYAVTLATEFDKAYNTLQTQTGATTEEMKGLNSSMEEIYKRNLGENMDDIAQSMATVKTQTKLTGKELESVTANALVMRDTFGFEVNESIRTVNSLMNQFGITADEAYNLIAQGAQNGLNQNDDLLDTINEYSVQFEMLGYNADDMFNMLKNGASEGTWSVDKLGDAVKEFNIRAKDGSESTANAFGALGLTVVDNSEQIEKAREKVEKYEKQISTLESNIKYAKIQQSEFTDKTSDLTKLKTADNIAKWSTELEGLKADLSDTSRNLGVMEEMQKKGGQSAGDLFDRFAQGGDTAKEATQEVITALFAMEDKVKQDEVGVALFGTMWEDLGADAVRALLDTQGEISKTGDALDKINEQKYDDIGSALQGLGRTIQTDVVQPLGEELKPVIEEAIDYVKENGPEIKEVLSNVVTAIGNFVKLIVDNKDVIIGAIVAIGAGMLVWNVVGIITSVVGAIKGFITVLQTGKTVMQALNLVMSANPIGLIITLVASLVAGFLYLWNNCEGFREFFVNLWETIKNAVGTAIEAVSGFLSGLWDGIKNIFGNIGGWFKEKFTESFENAKKAWDGAKEIFSKVKDKVTGAFSNIGNWFKERFTESKNNAEKAWSNAKEVFTKVKDNVQGAFSKVGTWFKDKFTESKNNAEKAWSNAKTIFTKVKDNVQSAFSKVGSWFKDKFTEAKNNANNAWSNAKTVFGKVKDNVQSAFSTIGSWFKTKFTEAKNNSESAWSNAKTVFTNVKNKVTSAFSSLGSDLKSKFSSALEMAKSGFNKAKDIGSDIVRGLWNGINNMASWIKSKISGFGSSVLGALKDFFGIKSPSRVMADEVGKFLPQGIAIGIDNNAKSVLSSMKKVTDDTISLAKKQIEPITGLGIMNGPGNLNSIAQNVLGTGATPGANNAELFGKLDEMIHAFKSLKSTIVLDSGVLVGETITQIDAQLGNAYSLRERRA